MAADNGRAGAEEIRLLAVTHDLGYGGSQLYLFELLRQVVGAAPEFSCWVLSPRDGPLRPALEELGIQVHVTSGFPVQTVETYEGKMLELVAWARPHRFNVALINSMLAFPGADLGSRLKLPILWAIHESLELPFLWAELYPPSWLDPYVRSRAEEGLAEASALIFEADATRAQYEPHTQPERLVTIPYGIDLTDIDEYRSHNTPGPLRRKLGVPSDATVVLCLGTVEPRKAQTCLAQAFSAICAEHPHAILVFVGALDGHYSTTLETYIDRLNLGARIRLLPVTPDIYDWYACADVMVSASDVESLPRSVLEAMAFEVPILAAAVFGLAELLQDGNTGFLFPPRDTAALANRLDEVLSLDDSQRRAVGLAGSQLVRENHQSQFYASAYLRLMNALIKHPEISPGLALSDRLARAGAAPSVRR
jgi:glycosyltransferase involved in cell wall biosynthesis